VTPVVGGPRPWQHGTVPDPVDPIALFLAGARVVADAVAGPDVGLAWDRPSVLAEQTVGGLAGHLARGAVWVTGDYAAGDEPPGPVRFDSAGAYFATLADMATEESNRAIRDRGASVAAGGQAAVVAELEERLAALARLLPALGTDRRIAVVGGAVMRLGDYLGTRIVEQTVHLDDLARSLGRGPWPIPGAALDLTLAVAVDIGTARHGGPAMVRALFRDGFAGDALPVL